LSQGLRIAPPEAPMTGYMFGKGVYLADMFQKSYAYSMNRIEGQDSTLLLICEAALGNMKKLYDATPIEKLESPYNSVHGKG
jgi:poly [ADP-ribose] polymerase